MNIKCSIDFIIWAKLHVSVCFVVMYRISFLYILCLWAFDRHHHIISYVSFFFFVRHFSSSIYDIFVIHSGMEFSSLRMGICSRRWALRREECVAMRKWWYVYGPEFPRLLRNNLAVMENHPKFNVMYFVVLFDDHSGQNVRETK